MNFSNLEDSGLGLTKSQLSDLFEPYIAKICEDDDPDWVAQIERRQKKINKGYLKARLFSWISPAGRSEDEIVDEYASSWREQEYNKYTLEPFEHRLGVWGWGGRNILASGVGATRFRQLMLIRAIEKTRPRQVLEVGCGNGINLILLACRFPEIEFTGLELTEQGHRVATGFQEREALPTEMQDYAPEPLRDVTAFRRIRFVQGSAAQLPFDDDAFDLVTTVLALEQMEKVRHQALTELSRVTRANFFLIEPFRDMNPAGWPRKNVVRRNYFQGRLDDLPRYGLRPELVTSDFPQEVFLRVCAVLGSKQLPAA
jgi:ubiquinone/menaquinone biosynthesis C-methylase UbiE